MYKKAVVILILLALIGAIGFAAFLSGAFAPPKAELVKVGAVPAGEYGPEEWGKVYPLEHESWAATRLPRPAGKSAYKKGFDTDSVTYDKLSEFPYMALLFNGFGFGVEYNEPRGHHYMRIDQDIVDPSRVKAGGVCLNCKSPYNDSLVRVYGKKFYGMPWNEAVGAIPAKHKNLGVSCIDCHENSSMGLKTNREAFTRGLAKLGKSEYSRQEMRILVCGQCHNTYNIPKDAAMQSVGLEHPWEKSSWGAITIENIIQSIRDHPDWLEWKQSVTGFKLAFLRHPEFEFFTRQSVHFQAGLACADCHMPYKKSGAAKFSDHDVMSPMKNDLRACSKCHPDQQETLRAQVLEIQRSTVSMLNRAGYGCAAVAKLFEMTQGTAVDTVLFRQAKDFYLEALYRTIYMGAENSVGFHNPAEAGRILNDAVAFAARAEGLLRQALTKAGKTVPEEIPLDLEKYVNNRGSRKLNFKPEEELKDPFGTQDRLLGKKAKGL